MAVTFAAASIRFSGTTAHARLGGFFTNCTSASSAALADNLLALATSVSANAVADFSKSSAAAT